MTIALPHLKKLNGRKIMIGDNLSSHLSLKVIQKCEEHDIAFVFLPSNSTHMTQPHFLRPYGWKGNQFVCVDPPYMATFTFDIFLNKNRKI